MKARVQLWDELDLASPYKRWRFSYLHCEISETLKEVMLLDRYGITTAVQRCGIQKAVHPGAPCWSRLRSLSATWALKAFEQLVALDQKEWMMAASHDAI